MASDRLQSWQGRLTTGAGTSLLLMLAWVLMGKRKPGTRGSRGQGAAGKQRQLERWGEKQEARNLMYAADREKAEEEIEKKMMERLKKNAKYNEEGKITNSIRHLTGMQGGVQCRQSCDVSGMRYNLLPPGDTAGHVAQLEGMLSELQAGLQEGRQADMSGMTVSHDGQATELGQLSVPKQIKHLQHLVVLAKLGVRIFCGFRGFCVAFVAFVASLASVASLSASVASVASVAGVAARE
eukprot:50549-Prymnesium_polylepis.1